MVPQLPDAQRRAATGPRLRLALAALGLVIVTLPVRSQTQQENPPPAASNPANAAQVRAQQNAAAAAAQLRAQQNAAAAAAQLRAQQNAAAAAAQLRAQQNAAAAAAQLRAQQNAAQGAAQLRAQQNAAAAAAQLRAQQNAAAAQRRTPPTAPAAPGNTHNPASDLHVASLDNGRAGASLVQSRNFLGHPGPPGSTETRSASGKIVRTAADGTVIDVRNPRNGMTIHHGLDGSRRILVEQPDHSRIYATTRGLPYVQHPFVFRGRALNHRTYPVGGQLVHLFYRPYSFGGTTLDVYAPTRYYDAQFYQQASSPFPAPQAYRWPYANNSTPWYGYYKGYFTPEPTYTSPVSWLTDFVLGASLAVAYATERPTAPPPPASATPAVTPEVKQMLNDEVGRQLKQESVEAQQNAANRDLPPGAGGVVQELGDGQAHVFVVSSDLDLVDPTGRRCMISEGDVVQVVSAPRADTSTADAVVMASKGGEECGRAAQVQIAVADLQEMQNHMRETIDLGIASSDAGKKAPTATPAFAAAAPPPDPNTAREIEQQQQIAAAADS